MLYNSVNIILQLKVEYIFLLTIIYQFIHMYKMHKYALVFHVFFQMQIKEELSEVAGKRKPTAQGLPR